MPERRAARPRSALRASRPTSRCWSEYFGGLSTGGLVIGDLTTPAA